MARDQDMIDKLRLIRSRRVGPVTWHRLLAEYGSAAAALAALPDVAKAAGVKDYECCPEGVVLTEMAAGRRAGARLVCHGTADYPPALAELSDAPPILWVKGRQDLLARPMLALVGARNASSLGIRMARRLAETLGQTHAIVSGLARGIDTVAHEAALDSGTVAVLAGGIDVIYPAENTDLAKKLAEKGCLISEQPPGTEPQARHFPLRNRIVSGLSRAVVVVEAASQSGSLITAKLALEQGREVMAVPGHPFDGRAGGCNALIRDGAILVRGAEDVLAALAPTNIAAPVRRMEPAPPPPAPTPRPTNISQLHQQILDRLGPSPLAEDQLIRDIGLPPATLAPELLNLELEGRVQRQPGGLLARIA
ncbi:DNA-processing protein DprA [Neogemmobacter tilapiae]|uniref:DNA processing protein DprA n=1 Tax=Neogemmobacter tilapiae TaxID=875041 RepID=A0A918TK04_9RHOB|nr:DNA-processing protein DprA [Gemmobacter tilapiae]GHC49462.1 DNA processing protein DprA [Gemmobacter tilapiae]